MDEHQTNGFDHSTEPTGPETDDSVDPTEAAPDPDEKPRAPAGREMLIQLQQMIDTIALQAAPVIREVGAKAAELAGVAGQKAGPVAHRAADVTEQFGQRVAARSKDIAADLRRPRGDEPTPDSGGNGNAAGEGTDNSGSDEGSGPGI